VSTLIVLLLLIAVFYGQLEASYRWLESNFLKTFEASAKSQGTTNVLRSLAPWDAHLVRLKVHPNAEIAGKTLQQVELRKKRGLNVIAIQRGLRTIVAPRPDQVIYPKDELLILATDEQIDAARIPIEKPPGLQDRFRHISGYELQRVLIAPESPLAHRSIRDSGLRERYGAMAVGLERGTRRMINPDSDLVLAPGDVLYVVGETESLRKLSADLAPPPAST
jgi:CPA2 family monovalent cation:H+ antiporter-2